MDHALAENDASEVVQFLSNDELSLDSDLLKPHNASSPQSVHTKRWREKISSRSCLVRAVQRISQDYSVSDILSNIDKDQNGKPLFRDLPIDFSYAHSRGMVAAVAIQKVDNRAIGIDLEVNPPHSVDSFARVCTKVEWSEIQSMEHPVARKSAFLRRWCAKEAYVKALGEGLGYGFKHLEVRRSPEHATQGTSGHSHAEEWTLTDKKQKSHPTHPIYTWEMDSATQDGAICISLAYATLSTSSSPAQDPQSPVLEFLINDGQGLPDFK